MNFVINVIRNLVGSIIVAIDLLTRGPKLKRTPEQQRQVAQEIEALSLYQFYACPFCVKTRRVMHKLNLPITKRNASHGSPYRDELLQGGGKIQTPCLRIEEGSEVTWLYESSDIITYLEKRFSQA